jgi:nucleoprotein TPR
LKSDEVVSATAGKEEALTSALAEITHLKEEILTKTYVLSLYHIAKFTAVRLDET